MSPVFAFNTTELADGESRTVPAAPHIAVYRVGDDFYATQDSCSHEEWSLGEEGALEGYEILCSLHMARFDVRDGRALCLPALNGLKTYPVTVTNGRVLVDIDAESGTADGDPGAGLTATG
jgi:nitrite reductase/ring-hydroxylating ferredoxin subunit